MSPSSTSSSERAGWRRFRGGILAVALLLAFELVVARSDAVWVAHGRSKTGVFELIESGLRGRPEWTPRVLLLGNSRILDALDPRGLEARWNLQPGDAINLGLTNGSPADALALYRRNRARLRGAGIAILNIDDWHFGASHATETDRRFADLRMRLTDFEGSERNRLVVGWAWRTYDSRNVVRNLLRGVAFGPAEDAGPRMDAEGRLLWRPEESEFGPTRIDCTPDVIRAYQRFRASDTQVRRLEELARLLREDGSSVVVVRLPARSAYENLAIERYADAYSACRARMAELTRALPWVCVLDLTHRDRHGLPDRHFYDYGHATLAGRRTATALVAEHLEKTIPEAVERLGP